MQIAIFRKTFLNKNVTSFKFAISSLEEMSEKQWLGETAVN